MSFPPEFFVPEITLGRLQKTGNFPTDIDLSIGITSAIIRDVKKKGLPLSRGMVSTHRENPLFGIPTPISIDACLSKINTKSVTTTDFEYSLRNCFFFDNMSYLASEWIGNGNGLRAIAISWAKSEYLLGISDWCTNVTLHFNETLIDEDYYMV